MEPKYSMQPKYTKDSGELPEHSFGTQPVLDMISLLGEKRLFNYDTIIINLTTLYRNVKSENKDTKTTEINKLINREINTLINYIKISTNLSKMINVNIIFYMANYTRNFPKEIIKEKLPKNTLIVDDYIKTYISELKDNVMVDNKVKVIFLPIRNGNVVETLKNKINNAGNMFKVLLLSHLPYEYHLTDIYKNMNIIYSHTGGIYDKAVLSEKVFKNDNIPFYTSTHYTLGDKEYLEGFASRKQKSIIKKLAEEEHWNTHSRNYVSERLQKILNDGV